MKVQSVDKLKQFWRHSPYIINVGQFPPEVPYAPPMLPENEISVEETNVNITRPERVNSTDIDELILRQPDYDNGYSQLESLSLKELDDDQGKYSTMMILIA